MRLTPEQKRFMRCTGCGGEMFDDFERSTYVLGCSTCNERRHKQAQRAGHKLGRHSMVPKTALEPRQFFEHNHPMVIMTREHER